MTIQDSFLKWGPLAYLHSLRNDKYPATKPWLSVGKIWAFYMENLCDMLRRHCCEY